MLAVVFDDCFVHDSLPCFGKFRLLRSLPKTSCVRLHGARWGRLMMNRIAASHLQGNISATTSCDSFPKGNVSVGWGKNGKCDRASERCWSTAKPPNNGMSCVEGRLRSTGASSPHSVNACGFLLIIDANRNHLVLFFLTKSSAVMFFFFFFWEEAKNGWIQAIFFFGTEAELYVNSGIFTNTWNIVRKQSKYFWCCQSSLQM